MEQWTTLVLLALAAAIFLQIDWAMYLFAVLLVGLATLVQKSEVVVVEKLEAKPEEKRESKAPTQIIVTQPTTGGYMDMVYSNIMSTALLRGKRGLSSWSKSGTTKAYSTYESGLGMGDFTYPELDTAKSLGAMQKTLEKISKKLGAEDK